MENIHILGHDNTSLSVILDIIHHAFDAKAKVTIVSNLLEKDNPQRAYAFLHPKLKTKEVYHKDWHYMGKEHFVLGSMGTHVRKVVYKFFNENYQITPDQFIQLDHPHSAVGNGVERGAGVTVNPGVVVAPFTELHDFVYLNRNCSIGHHTVLEEFVSVNPGAIVNGKCRIGKNTTIGAGSVVNDGVSIGSNSIIGAGAVVTKDIPDHVIAFGSPAKVVREFHPSFGD